MPRKSFVLLVLALITVLMVGAVTAQEAAPLRVGLMVDQSGALTVYGFELEYGFKLGLLYAAGINPADYDSIDAALAEVVAGGRPVEILLRDNGGDAETGASQARELIEQEGVEILVGAPSSAVTTSLQQVALDYEVLLFAAPGASPDITGVNFNVNTFRVCRNAAQDALALASFATQGLGTEWVILAADYEFGRASATAFQNTLGAFGVNFVTEEPIFAPLETTDFTQYVQAVLDSGAETLLPIWAGETTVTLYQQLGELGVFDAMNVIGAFNSNDIMALADPALIDSVAWIVYHYTFPQNAINDWLVENHRAVYNDVPDLFTECGFATAQALFAAVEGAGGDTLPSALTPQLEGYIFEGPKGTYGIRPSDHQALVPMYVARLANLDDPDFAYYELLAEIPAAQVIPPVLLNADLAAERTPLDEEFMAEFMSMAPMATEEAGS
jgi:branched-chain amino acid transport system substrate-binding protein